MTQITHSKMEDYLTAKQEARRGRLLVSAVALLAALGLVIAAGMLVAPMNKIRREKQIVLDDETLKGLPPDIVLLTQTGTLRALAIDMAFIRMENLKQKDRFYELMQLSDWLCKLVPRYASVWSYSAWNMAYNISVAQFTPEARWMWVMNGIENLRNQGLRYNPKSVTLYKELAWIFFNKIGAILDDYHWAYKRELAVSMERILGEPPLVLSEDDAVNAFRKIVDAPRSIDDWAAHDPKARELIDKLAGDGMKPDASLLYFVARYMRTYSDVSQFEAKGTENTPPAETESEQADPMTLLTSKKYADTVDTLLAAVRSQVIRHDLNMNIDWMLKLMEKYGPIDWRSPYAHSLYWSTYGDMVTKGMITNDPADSMNTVRFIFFSLENLARAGHIILEPDFDQPNKSFMQMLPDMRYIKYMHQAYLTYGEEQFKDDPRFVRGTAGPNYAAGQRNFLRTAIQQLYIAGGEKNLEEAKEYYFYLREYDRADDGSVKPAYIMPFEQFVFSNMFEAIDTVDSARMLISEMLNRSLIQLADGATQRSVDNFNEAKKMYEYYMRNTDTDPNTRRKLDRIGVIRKDVALAFMLDRRFSVLQKNRLWRRLDLPTRQAIYDKVLPFMKKVCETQEPPLVLEKVLPTPPGMAEYRKNPDAVLTELKRLDENVSLGEKIPN